MEDKKDREADARKAGGVVPAKFFAQIGHREDSENGQGYDFLNGLELSCGEFVRPDAVCGNLKAIFKESDAPTGENHFPKCLAAVFQVAVPGEGHKDVGNRKK